MENNIRDIKIKMIKLSYEIPEGLVLTTMRVYIY